MKSQLFTPFRGLGMILLLTGIVILVTGLSVPPKTPIQDFEVKTALVPKLRQPAPDHINIAGTIDLPVEVMSFGLKGWEVASQAASIASTSAYPGESGNIIIYSHNLRELFGKLSKVKIGDQVKLSSKEGATHLYTVTKRVVVNPDQIDSLRPTDSETLTLYTCTGLFDSKRLVVQAVPQK